SSSWLNLIERWFAKLTDKQIRRGIFHSVPELIQAIKNYIKVNNKDPIPFVWTASVQSIMEKINRCKAIYATQHSYPHSNNANGQILDLHSADNFFERPITIVFVLRFKSGGRLLPFIHM